MGEEPEPELDVPEFGVVLFAVPGKVPHGEPGVFPGVVFGLTVEGCVVLLCVGELGFVPGTVDGAVGVAEPDCCAAVPD